MRVVHYSPETEKMQEPSTSARRAVLWAALAWSSVAYVWATSSWVAQWDWDLAYFVLMGPGVIVPLVALAIHRWRYSSYVTLVLGLGLVVFAVALLLFGSFVFLPSAALLIATPAVPANRQAPRRFKPTLLVVSLASGALVLAPTLSECLPLQWEVTVILSRGATTAETETLGRDLTGTDVWAGSDPEGVYYFVVNDLARADADQLRQRAESARAVDRVVLTPDERCAGVDPEDGL